MKVVMSSHLHHMLCVFHQKSFHQSICRTKEQKTRSQRLASAMPKFAMPSGAEMRKVCWEVKRNNLAVLAKTSKLNRFFQQSFQAATLKQWRQPEHLKL